MGKQCVCRWWEHVIVTTKKKSKKEGEQEGGGVRRGPEHFLTDRGEGGKKQLFNFNPGRIDYFKQLSSIKKNPQKNERKKRFNFFLTRRLKFTRKSPTSTKAPFYQVSEWVRPKNIIPEIAEKEILLNDVGRHPFLIIQWLCSGRFKDVFSIKNLKEEKKARI